LIFSELEIVMETLELMMLMISLDGERRQPCTSDEEALGEQKPIPVVFQKE
jgi:hypothetical protein